MYPLGSGGEGPQAAGLQQPPSSPARFPVPSLWRA